MHNIITNTISHRGFITLLALVMSISLYAQNLVKGTVVDETDLPLIGATVLIKGNSGGTITDIDGNYSINAKKGSTIVVSYIGYKTQEVKYTGQQKVNIKMIPDNQALDEVVVVGYGSMKRFSCFGSRKRRCRFSKQFCHWSFRRPNCRCTNYSIRWWPRVRFQHQHSWCRYYDGRRFPPVHC